MKFDEVKPDARHHEEIDFEGDLIVYFDSESECCVCKQKTHWASMSFEAFFCSEECNRKMWEDMNAAIRRCNEQHG